MVPSKSNESENNGLKEEQFFIDLPFIANEIETVGKNIISTSCCQRFIRSLN